MAITHFTPQLISRADGRSVVLAAAYRHCAKMTFEAEDRAVDYTGKRSMVHEEFLLPADAPHWVRAVVSDRSVAGASEAFWNKVEGFEKRSDAQLSKEYIIALPIELTTAQNIALMRQFVDEHILPAGMVADWVYHDDRGNPHAHLMTSLRPLTEDGFGPKRVRVLDEDGALLRNRAGKIVYKLWAGDKNAFLAVRQGWIDLQNHHLALAGLDVRVDGRSYAERGIDIVPTTHVGVAAKAIERKAKRQGRRPGLDRLRLFGQERNLLTSAIGRMNLFLHGIEDFRIVRGDTLANPAFVEGDRLMQFDVVLANPPYSIKQWDRDAWSADPWGRNIYGTPPQGRADYAFWQHIIKSMKAKSGRCAILFPHGVLFRNEESAMREKLVAHDVVECVLGLGPNLFYNSPMEACVVICQMNKPKERRNKVLFINAVNEVTRERAQSFLTEDHIQRIVAAYQAFGDEDGFARVVSNDEVREKGSNLSIPLYVRADNGNGNGNGVTETVTFKQAIANWQQSSIALRETMDGLLSTLEGGLHGS